MRLIDADKLMDSLRGNVLVDVTPALEEAVIEQPAAYGWIPVEERPPKTEDGYDYVMVCMDDGFVTATDYTDCDEFSLWEDSGKVIAWMPLPEPYRP